MNKTKKNGGSILIPFSADFYDSNKGRDKDDCYYDAMELLGGGAREIKKALKLLNIALEMDKDYVQTYIGFISAYHAVGDQKKIEEAVKSAYDKTLKKFPHWPKKMEWGDLNNRAYLRAIQYLGDLYWDKGENEKAIELFRLLLRLNPNDNQGVRYELAALYAGLKGNDINKMTDKGNRKQDWSEREKLVKVQNAKYKFWTETHY
ncbi:MAG: tetratricopeptide repeat protein [Patescibacteria group bacterium]